MSHWHQVPLLALSSSLLACSAAPKAAPVSGAAPAATPAPSAAPHADAAPAAPPAAEPFAGALDRADGATLGDVMAGGAGAAGADEDYAMETAAPPEPEPMKMAEPEPSPAANKKPTKKAATPPELPKPTKTVRYLSADDSNSAASPVIARKTIRSGQYVQPGTVRTYEFLNYYSFAYPAAKADTIRIVPQMRPLDQEGEVSLQVAVRSEDRSLAALPPFNITFLLDASGSMAGEPFALAEAFILAFASKLRTGDRLSLVVCNREATVLLQNHEISKDTPAEIKRLLDAVAVNDITDLEKGVLAAYEIANRVYDAGYLNRVILVSDGADNAGANATQTIGKYAEDKDRQGIYLAGIGLGRGFNDYLMDSFTDKGRGAYIFLDSHAEIDRVLDDRAFVAAFDLAAKDIRLKMVMPPDWKMEEFHGEQISSRAADVVPQYISPNDQMLYHLTISTRRPWSEAKQDIFVFEAEFTPLGKKKARLNVEASVADMVASTRQILKGDAIVAYAEALKRIEYPLVEHQESNLEELDAALDVVLAAQKQLDDPELEEVLGLLRRYRSTVEGGEVFANARDRTAVKPELVMGLSPKTVREVRLIGALPERAIKALERLGHSSHLRPQEGYRFVALSSGPIWNPSPAGGAGLGGSGQADPTPAFMGKRPHRAARRPIHDLHQIRLELRAPKDAKSFSFDFNFFSAEYPAYVNQSYNDTFYAILEARSTNGGDTTNIAFDAHNNSIEVDNNYFQQAFHPVPNTGTGFDAHGSTGWLRTSWPIRGGEEFALTFSIHDEGDAIFDSLVVLDNFRWHEYEAVGTTDPLN